MEVTSLSNSCEHGQPGIFRGHLRFESARLAGYRWEICEIRGKKPGPRLCIGAGIHPNEVSAIEAAVRLQRLFDPESMAGSVSIIPFINQPGLFEYPDYVCPLDGKNIEHTFPGKKDGTFSEALCDAIMKEWCEGADCFIDMHGGNLRENVSKFVIIQQAPDTQLNDQARRLAMCFDAEFVLALPTRFLDRSGTYSPSAFAREGRLAVLPEAGANGLATEDTVSFFVNGVLNVARTLGIISTPLADIRNAQVVCDDYLWVYCPVGGDFHSEVEPGDSVIEGQRLGTITNLFGETLAEVSAPASGCVLWRVTHPSIKEGSFMGAIGTQEQRAS
ncbi:succinylglutamate desuccinylase/aspartoacylase family protein [Mesorhizobium sp. VK9D]|uniref:succinylglutamate desuccinylase/aspartoacylase family protein n=1 Tax=Mesorhizobium australafricanum TaxID=3072311 RepID=UPI002A24BCE5|nr:succinylglutamate desuccinylase/aspartoacylase family protein [Mesorhizobium sp. VK9D]MDX8455289.1 succinylglutamate desuccinylase/aspartoacylase family protein [Mesorhizobium sp. VK9D]